MCAPVAQKVALSKMSRGPVGKRWRLFKARLRKDASVAVRAQTLVRIDGKRGPWCLLADTTASGIRVPGVLVDREGNVSSRPFPDGRAQERVYPLLPGHTESQAMAKLYDRVYRLIVLSEEISTPATRAALLDLKLTTESKGRDYINSVAWDLLLPIGPVHETSYGRSETLGFLPDAEAVTKAQRYLRVQTASQARATDRAVRGAVEFFSAQRCERLSLFLLPENAPLGTEHLIERMLAGATLLDDGKLNGEDLANGYEGVCATLEAAAKASGREPVTISRMRPLAHDLRMRGWPLVNGPGGRGYRLPGTMAEVHDWGLRAVAKQKTSKERIERLELAKRLWYGGADGGPARLHPILKHSSTPSPQSSRLFGDATVAKVKRQQRRAKRERSTATRRRYKRHGSGAAVIQRQVAIESPPSDSNGQGAPHGWRPGRDVR